MYSALLLSLARKKYVTLTEQPLSDVVITLSDKETETLEPLSVCEKYYYNLLVRHAVGNQIKMKDLQERVSDDYSNTETFSKNMNGKNTVLQQLRDARIFHSMNASSKSHRQYLLSGCCLSASA